MEYLNPMVHALKIVHHIRWADDGVRGVFRFMVLFREVLNLITSQHLTVNSSAWKKYSPAHDEVV